MPKFLPWADPPAGTYDRQHGTQGKAGDPTKNYEIITQAGRESRGFLDLSAEKGTHQESVPHWRNAVSAAEG